MSFNALYIDYYLCGGIHSKGYAPGEQTTALLQELTAILDRLKSDDYEPNLHTIWLSAKRPTFRQYYEQYYPETPYDIVDAETKKNARRAYTIAYPCAEVWYHAAAFIKAVPACAEQAGMSDGRIIRKQSACIGQLVVFVPHIEGIEQLFFHGATITHRNPCLPTASALSFRKMSGFTM